MNKTVTVNIASIVFHIDEDAYGKLNQYLKNIRKSINTEGRDEIIQDIENRIAELFSERINTNNQVIMLKDVDYIIQIMGQPEDYILDEDEAKPLEEKKAKPIYQKKLYRDGEKNVLGGVLAGLGHYFKIDVVWLRILFAVFVFFYGTGIVIYIILWIIIPKAVTTSEILEMKGEPINISSIEKKVRENIDYESDNTSSVESKKYRKNVKKTSDTGLIIRRIVGIICIFIGLILLTGSIASQFVLFGNNSIYQNPFLNFMTEISTSVWCFWLLFFLISCIPPIIIFLIGLKLIYANLRYIGLICLLLIIGWFASSLSVAIIFAKHSAEIKKHVSKNITDSIKDVSFKEDKDLLITNDTLKIVFVNNDYFESEDNKIEDFKTKITEKAEKISLDILKSYQGKAYIEISLRTERLQAYDLNSFEDVLNIPPYNYKIEQNLLILSDSLLNIDTDDYIINKAKIYVYLPKNIAIGLDKSTHMFIDDNLTDSEGVHYYQLKNNSLKCTDCP